MLTERELCGLDAYLRMRVLGERIKITAANLADVGAMWWAKRIETPPFSSLPVGSEAFSATVGGQIPRETLHGLAERAGISFRDATRLSLFDLVLLATAGRAAAAGPATATGPGSNAETATAAEIIGLVSPEGGEVLLLAEDKTKNAEQRMRLIVALDPRYAGFSSEQWATLLSVTSAAIRKLSYWKNDLRGER